MRTGPVVERDGRMWVPGNRWDLVADRVGTRAPSNVAVVVTHFEQPASLRRMYAALADLDPAAYELVVADDGSRCPPVLPPADFRVPTRVVSHPDLGYRPGATRNLGASATTADVLVFLDADTVPARGTVTRLAAWPALVPDTLVVGRRGHVDLDGWSAADTVAWLHRGHPAPDRRPDPPWLADGYRATRDLLDADDRSYRFVISAVMACHRRLWEDLGGFEGTRDEYGGEDWEFASRAFTNGAVLVHDAEALAWHDEPDWAQRNGGSKADETMWLATMIAEPLTRGRAIRQPWPDTLVQVATPPAPTGALVATIGDVVGDVPDCLVELPAVLPRSVRRYVAHDQRLTCESPTPMQRQRARHVVTISRTSRWPPGSLRRVLDEIAPARADIAEVIGEDGAVVASAVSTRVVGRRRRAGDVPIGDLIVTTRHVGPRSRRHRAPSGRRARDGAAARRGAVIVYELVARGTVRTWPHAPPARPLLRPRPRERPAHAVERRPRHRTRSRC